jgi:hypothetical protein
MNRLPLVVVLLLILALTSVTTGLSGNLAPLQQGDLLQSSGKITFLRAHDVGTAYGPPTDQIDVEVVIQIDTRPGQAFGFQVRDDGQRAARQGMLDLLRDAFNNNWTVTIDYFIEPGKNNGRIIRVALTK